MIETSQPAPDFSLPADDGSTFTLSGQRGEKLLLVFYPGDNTPVCTRQLCDYRDGVEAFADLGVRVVGISGDGLESQHVVCRKAERKARKAAKAEAEKQAGGMT